MTRRTALLGVSLFALSACASVGTSPRAGPLNLAKECSSYSGAAGHFCTVTSSNLSDIPTGTRITYLTAASGTNLDTDVVVDPPGTGDTVAGHCTLSLATGIGACTLSGGTGKFSAFRANVAVTHTGGPNYAWSGTYGYTQ
jgi:hypothetical protein